MSPEKCSLGVTFDESLSFNALVNEIRVKCFSLLNIIKILSNSKWGLKILHHEGWSQLSLNKIDHRLDELTERYVRNALENSVDMVVQLVKEYNLGFESRYINFPTPLCNCRGIIEDFLQV
ncbi:hypothetical protein BpHYR1_000417 [Brachionus plicatilis]|uniref:RNA-directed DNA polymerase from mobile element jockey-like n=1 Tax=Brachionus plicatilis TaxID=10195 RepID=A0A3M7PVA9_BRAPC|nr:hypothetical protein BpHYR1_000417 [Brachionus plicatilis]